MDAEQFNRISKVLADPRRFEVLERIAAVPELACATLAETLPISQATISHHLKELTAVDLLEVRRESKYAFLKLRRPVFEAYLNELQRRLSG